MKLRTQGALAIGAVVLLVVAVAAVAHLVSVARITLGAAETEGQMLASQLYHQTARAIAQSPPPSPVALARDPGIRALLEGMVGYSRTVVYAAVADPVGRVLVHSDPALEGRVLAPHQDLQEVKARGALWVVASVLAGPPKVYEARVPLQIADRPFGTVRVGVSTSLLRQELVQAALHSLLLAATGLLAAAVVGLTSGHALLRSLRKIALGMERLARGELGANVDLTRDDELGDLAARVNRMGEQVQARLEGILDSFEDAVILLDGLREVVFANQAAAGVLGARPEAVLGRPFDAALPDDHPLVPIVSELFEHGIERHNAAVKVVDASGQVRELAVSSYRVQSADGAVLALKDLDPVRAVQSLVTYSQKLSALGRLTSGVAHEVKNPLNAMRIHLELLKTRLAGGHPEVAENVEVIALEIQRLDRVVQDFLRFVRPQELRLAPVDLNALLGDVARLMAPAAEQGGARIVLDLAPRLMPTTGDAELLQQACANLVSNAVQAMPAGGTVTLATRQRLDGAVEVCVRDEGVGIAAEDLDKIFRLYYTTRPDGSGIGLSLVYRIASMHDGRIDVESVVNQGTTMRLTLPSAASGGVM